MNKIELLEKLLTNLWGNYKKRVKYANFYAELVESKGGNVVNDHIAFRSIKTDIPNQESGIKPFVEIFSALGYEVKSSYIFKTKKLAAIHLEHNSAQMPKIFVSELELDKFAHDFQKIIKRNTSSCVAKINETARNLLHNLKENDELDQKKSDQLINHLTNFFQRPWSPPQRSDVFEANKFSQYAAWVLLHGNSVNHFTAYINYQNVKEWPDIEATLTELAEQGIPLKNELEGEKGSILRQSATEAVIENCEVHDAEGSIILIPWSYAYYEFAERGFIKSSTGEQELFQGFLGEQATNLFEMTNAKK